MSASEIRKHLNLFESVEQLPPADREAMLAKDGMKLREIADPTMDECIIAIKQNMKAMWYVPLFYPDSAGIRLNLRNQLEHRLPYEARYCSRKDLPPGAIYDTRQTGDMIAWNSASYIYFEKDSEGTMTGLRPRLSESESDINQIRWIKEPSVLAKDGMQLRWVKEPTVQECLTAINQNRLAAWYVPIFMRRDLDRYYTSQSSYNHTGNFNTRKSKLPPGALIPDQPDQFGPKPSADPLIFWHSYVKPSDIRSMDPLASTQLRAKSDFAESDQKLTRLIRHVYQQNPKKLAAMLREAIGDTQKNR